MEKTNNKNPGCIGWVLNFFNLSPKNEIPYHYYVKTDTLFDSKAENKFYGVLRKIVGNKFVVIPQVGMEAVINVKLRIAL